MPTIGMEANAACAFAIAAKVFAQFVAKAVITVARVGASSTETGESA